MQNSLKSGICPKCSSSEVYTDKSLPKRGDRVTIAVSSMKWFFVDTFLCTSCGHFEEYINENEMKDAKTIQKVKDTWDKVK